MENKKLNLLEKEVTDAKKKLTLEDESATKLFSRLSLDFSCYQPLIQSSPSCRGSAYSLMEKPLYPSVVDIGVNRLMNPLGSAYASLFGSSSCGLPCDLGLMR